MGEEGAISSGERSSPRQIGREGDYAAQQPKGISRPNLSSGGRPTAGGHQLSLRYFRRQAGSRRPTDTQ